MELGQQNPLRAALAGTMEMIEPPIAIFCLSIVIVPPPPHLLAMANKNIAFCTGNVFTSSFANNGIHRLFSSAANMLGGCSRAFGPGPSGDGSDVPLELVIQSRNSCLPSISLAPQSHNLSDL